MTEHGPVRTYVLNFFQPDPNWKLQTLDNYIRESKAFIGWHNHLPLVYFVMSRLSADEITQRLIPILGGANFIVAEINRFNLNGQMPPKSWDWFYSIERANAALPSGLPPEFELPLGLPDADRSRTLADLLQKYSVDNPPDPPKGLFGIPAPRGLQTLGEILQGKSDKKKP